MLRRIAEAIVSSRDWRGKRRTLGAIFRFLEGVPIRSLYGPVLVLRSSDFTSLSAITGMYHEDYDDVFAEVSSLRSGMAFIDVGANVGLFSMVAGDRVGAEGAVVAFEPALRVFRDLVDNAAINRLTCFYPFNCAIGDSLTIAKFDPGSERHSGIAHLDPDGSMSVLQVRADDLDNMLACIIGERSGIVKIDVEGAEAMVIESMATWLQRPQIEKVIVEIDQGYLSRFGNDVSTVYELMTKLGFEGRRGMGAATHYNEVFVRRDATGTPSRTT